MIGTALLGVGYLALSAVVANIGAITAGIVVGLDKTLLGAGHILWGGSKRRFM